MTKELSHIPLKSISDAGSVLAESMKPLSRHGDIFRGGPLKRLRHELFHIGPLWHARPKDEEEKKH